MAQQAQDATAAQQRACRSMFQKSMRITKPQVTQFCRARFLERGADRLNASALIVTPRIRFLDLIQRSS
jgi:hypothetical protein